MVAEASAETTTADGNNNDVSPPNNVTASSSSSGGITYGREPARDILCVNCRRIAAETKLDHEPGFASFLTFMGLFVVGLWPFLWVPFTNMSKLPDTYHRCPNCGVCMGRYKVVDLSKLCGRMTGKSSSAESLAREV